MQFPQNVVGVQQCSRYSINSKTRHGSYILPRYAWSGCSKYSWVHVQITKKQASTVDRPPPPLSRLTWKKNHTVNYFCVTKTHRQQLSRVTSSPRKHRPDTPPESNDSCSQCWFSQQVGKPQLCRVWTRFALKGLYTQTQHCKRLIARV